MNEDVERARRLSGECPRIANYVRQRGGRIPMSDPELRRTPYGNPGSYPEHPPGNPETYKNPYHPDNQPGGKNFNPRNAPRMPFKPFPRKGKPFGRRVPIPAGPRTIGGLTPRALRRLLRHPLFTLGGLALDFVPWGWQPERYFDMTGWRMICSIPGAPDSHWKQSTNDPHLPCGTSSQVPNSWFGSGVGLNANTRWVAYGPGGTRMTLREQWYRDFGGTTLSPNPNYPGTKRSPDFPIPALPWPAIDPFLLPPLVPLAPPRPIPFRVIPRRRPNPDRDPQEQPGGEQPSSPASPRPASPGSSIPVIEIPIVPGPAGAVPKPPRPGYHVRRPPRKKERESKKMMAIDNRGALGFIIGAIGEGADMLGVLWDSLPWEIRKQFKWKDSTILDRGAFILENIEHIQWGHVLANAVANQLEDAGFGKLGRQAAKGNRNLHKEFGIDLSGRTPKGYLNKSPYVPDEWTSAFDDWLSSLM